MVKGRSILFLFLLAFAFSAKAQDEIEFSNWEDLSVNPSSHDKIYVDCGSSDCKKVLENLSSFSRLSELHLYHLNNYKNIPSFDASRNVSITIAESPNLDFKKALKKIKNEDALQELNLIDNELEALPVTLTRFENLSSLNCSGNEDLELTDNLAVLNSLSRLTKLTWTRNDASLLPSSISFYNRLQHLDISDNGMVEFPQVRPNPLRNLQYLDISDNIIIDMKMSLKNLGMRLIKDVYLDGEGLNAYDVREIQDLHSKAIFHFADLDTTVVVEEDSLLKALEDAEKGGEEYGQLTTSASGTKILSNSYLYYPEVFGHGKFKYTFDTTSFEGRYKSSKYENVRPILPGRTYENLALEVTHKPIKGELWFEFAVITHHWFWGYASNSAMRRYINRYNKELNAFRNMVFVSLDGYEKKEFKKKFVKDKFYTDFRIYYDEGDSKFILELKTLEGFEEFSVYMRYKNKNYTLEKAQETYTKRYVRYMRNLDSRKKRFHKKLLQGKAQYDKQYLKTTELAWRDFAKLYFSDEEKEMTREEWLSYYDKVVANEKRAMDNANISMENLVKSLQLGGYIEVSYSDLLYRHELGSSRDIIFTDEKNDRLPAKSYAVIDKQEKTITVLEGGLGQDMNILIKGMNHRDIAVIAELRNGDMGVVKPSSYRKFELSQKEIDTLELEIYDHKLSHIGLFWDRIEF